MLIKISVPFNEIGRVSKPGVSWRQRKERREQFLRLQCIRCVRLYPSAHSVTRMESHPDIQPLFVHRSLRRHVKCGGRSKQCIRNGEYCHCINQQLHSIRYNKMQIIKYISWQISCYYMFRHRSAIRRECEVYRVGRCSVALQRPTSHTSSGRDPFGSHKSRHNINGCELVLEEAHCHTF